jgi:hypothetical protein
VASDTAFRNFIPGKSAMQRSERRFLTTHTGSLPRPEDLIRMMFAREEGVPVDQTALSSRIRSAVAAVVDKQAAAGLDVINDGEVSKPSYTTEVITICGILRLPSEEAPLMAHVHRSITISCCLT